MCNKLVINNQVKFGIMCFNFKLSLIIKIGVKVSMLQNNYKENIKIIYENIIKDKQNFNWQ